MRRSARIKIDLDALSHNLSVVRQYSNNAKIIAVIKANAYGHGMLVIAKHLEKKVDALAVACVSEAQYLRDSGIGTAIVVLQGFHDQQQLDQCFELNLEPVCHQPWQVDLLNQQAANTPLNCWLKVDSGMHRLGILTSDVETLSQKLLDSTAVNEVRLMTHFACADDIDSPLNQTQLNTFNKSREHLEFEISMANSAAILSIPESAGDWVRPGLMLYGASPFSDKTAAVFSLKPVMTLTSHIVAINSLSAGESLGYGSCWTCTRDSQIAVVAIGYGDGYPRHAKNGTPVIIKGQRCHLVGRVSMDMITVDITDLDSCAEIGEEIVLWGEQLDISEIASCSATIAYELLCNVGKDQ